MLFFTFGFVFCFFTFYDLWIDFDSVVYEDSFAGMLLEALTISDSVSLSTWRSLRRSYTRPVSLSTTMN